MNIVIVESPAKAKTIEKYLGKEFHTVSSVGHIRKIVKKTKNGTPPIDIKNQYKTTYEIDPDKKKIINDIKKKIKGLDTSNIWLATDEDREGESIAWHLCEVLNLDIDKTKRIVFNEITSSAINYAIKHPRNIDMNLVRAQQARQILDRIVGFELSPVVWQKVPGGKSAGRVQSPAVKLIVEREKEIEKFTLNSKFKIYAIFEYQNLEFKSELKDILNNEKEVEDLLKKLINAKYFIKDIKKSPSLKNPSAPFTTSTLQQEANNKLGFSSKSTMASAQRLYQEGKITYMRTDSVNISHQAIDSIKDYIQRLYGKEYSSPKVYKNKITNAQEAHEAIRPTDVTIETASNNEYDQKLYDLIRRRALASQMAPAKIEKTTLTIANDKISNLFEAKGQIILFDGFLRIYGSSKEEILPDLKKNDILKSNEVFAKQNFTKPPARYTEGSLVKKLEELGIGRPSTYATIMDTIQTREYVKKGTSEGQTREIKIIKLVGNDIIKISEEEKYGSEKGKLIPTPAGELIAGFLDKYFKQIVDYKFTANIETEFDAIAKNKIDRNIMLDSFYYPFHKLIEAASSIDRSNVGANKLLGNDPKTNRPIFARFGRYGPMLQLGSQDDTEKPIFAPFPKGEKIESITLEKALIAFELPRLVGKTDDGQEIKANNGRFGPYIQIGKMFISIKSEDPHKISLETALKIYKEKLKQDAEKNIKIFDDGIKILNGRFGPYITNGKVNVKVSSEINPKDITHEQAIKMIANKPKKRFSRKTKK